MRLRIACARGRRSTGNKATANLATSPSLDRSGDVTRFGQRRLGPGSTEGASGSSNDRSAERSTTSWPMTSWGLSVRRRPTRPDEFATDPAPDHRLSSSSRVVWTVPAASTNTSAWMSTVDPAHVTAVAFAIRPDRSTERDRTGQRLISLTSPRSGFVKATRSATQKTLAATFRSSSGESSSDRRQGSSPNISSAAR